jgi:ATP-dependent helicase HrpB
MAAALSEGLPRNADTLDLAAASLEIAHRGRGKRHDPRGRRLLAIRDDLVHSVTNRLGTPPKTAADRHEALSRAVLAAFPDRVARMRQGSVDRAVMVGGRGLRLATHGQRADTDLFVAVEVTAGDRGRQREARVSHMVPIERSWLAREFFETTTNHEFDLDSGRVKAVRRTTWRGLVLDEIEGPPTDPDRTAAVLARAAADDLEANLDLGRRNVRDWLARLRSLASWRPELDLPVFNHEQITAMLPDLCHGKASLSEVRKLSIAKILSGFLSSEQTAALDREAPERIRVPSGSRIRLVYEPGRPPVLAVRLQELFGMTETPTVAGGRIPVMLHLLAPNGRPQQITDDLGSFWTTTYREVRAELRGRYPKHHWPKNPLEAEPTARIRPRRRRG